jgi:penicillin-binding protein 2
MATTEINLAERSGNLVESHKSYDPRIIFFYFLLAAMLLTLAIGLGYQQLRKVGDYANAERQQNQRRILIPGPRGNIYDRNGNLLVGNKHRFVVLLHLDELKSELIRERIRIRNNYRETGDKDVPTYSQIEQIARVSLVQRYLDQVNGILGRDDKVNVRELRAHFARRLLLPYTLVDNLEAEQFARLIERLPVRSPLEVYAFNVRDYPYKGAAAQTLGYVRSDEEVEAEDFPGEDLTTFKMIGTSGKAGLEKAFDETLQGEAGGRIYRVDPTGYKINPPLEDRKPKQGKHLTTSLDIDLQLAAENELGDQTGAAVALDVNTGEVLVMASMPNYDLNAWYPRMTADTYKAIQEKNAEWHNALNGVWSPGSTFKILVSIAGMRSGRLDPTDTSVNCVGRVRIGNRWFNCENGRGIHGNIPLAEAIAHSCDSYFWLHGIDISPNVIAAEARRFHLGQITGIELPSETRPGVIPDPAWLKRKRGETWTDGHTANMSIGQGDVDLTPLQMACFAASVARGETTTKPTLLHDPHRPAQHTEPIGLTPRQRAALIEGMKGVITHGTAASTFKIRGVAPAGVELAGKTGTAQKDAFKDGKHIGKINIAWFICFAPVEKPEIAMAVAVVGDTAGESFEGSRYAAPVAAAVLRKYFEKKNAPAPKPIRQFFKTE